MTHLSLYNQLYLGRTIFIIGNGVQLNRIDSSLLDNQIVIGTNASYLWKSDMNFYIAGHSIFPILWDLFATPKDFNIFHGKPENLKLENLIVSKRNCQVSMIQHFKNNFKKEDYLVGSDMVGFSATHLALILGASRIVYIGFDSTVHHHFYDFLPYHLELKQNLRQLTEQYKDNTSLLMEINEFKSRHFPPSSNSMGLIFSSKGVNRLKFSSLFNVLNNKYNIETITTEDESITRQAGAVYKPLNELL